MSDRWYSMLGYAPDAFAPSYAAWRERVHPDDLAAAEAAIRAHFDREISHFAVDIRMRTQAGDWKWISSRGKVIERDASGSPLRMVGTHADITERKVAEARITAALQEKEVLLKEVYHRVKNNLQVIASLLTMQARGADDDRVRAALADSVSRVRAMALVREQLYRSNNLEHIAVKTYLSDLLSHLRETSPAFGRGIELTLEVGDNGIGVPEGFDFRQSATLGLRLVASLTNQVQGKMTLEHGGGTGYRLRVKEDIGRTPA